MRIHIHLVNPSDVSFGVGVITPRWLYVIAAATPASYGDPAITDETLERFDPDRLQPGDVIGIGIHIEAFELVSRDPLVSIGS